jgi:AhpD family alkylhydroperoxidase
VIFAVNSPSDVYEVASDERGNAMMAHYTDVIDDLREPTRSLRQAIPGAWDGFAQLHRDAVGEGALPAKVKELMALAIAVVKQCDGCIAYHAKAAARRGATPQEVAEALGVALLMDGGTASVYGPRAWEAYWEFAGHRADVKQIGSAR